MSQAAKLLDRPMQDTRCLELPPPDSSPCSHRDMLSEKFQFVVWIFKTNMSKKQEWAKSCLADGASLRDWFSLVYVSSSAYPNSVDLRQRQQQNMEAVNDPDFHFKIWGFALTWQYNEDLDCPVPISSTHHHAEKARSSQTATTYCYAYN